MTDPDPRLDEIQAIPEDAVEAAARAYRRDFPYDENEGYVVKLILEAAAPHMQAEAWEEGWAASRRFESAYEEEDQRKAATNPYRASAKTTILRMDDPNPEWKELK